jgi:hypothetical protein
VQHLVAGSVANWPKFRPQNTKQAGKKYPRPGKSAADSAPKIEENWKKSGREKFLETKLHFCIVLKLK